MKAAWPFFFAFVSAVLAQTPGPGAEFRTLEITYRLNANGALTEARTGELLLRTSPLISEFRKLSIPRRNQAGDVKADVLQLVHQGQTESVNVPPEKTRTHFVWDLTTAIEGDVIRFKIEQPVDPAAKSNDGWWFTNLTQLSLPVRDGYVTLILPQGFKGSVATKSETMLGGDYRWSISGAKGATDVARFTLSSFSDWSSIARWVAVNCQPSLTPAIVSIAAQIRASETEPKARITEAARVIHQRATLSDTGPMAACRPMDKVLETGTGNALEVQTAMSALLQSLGVDSDRILTGPENLANSRPDPEAFTGAMLRVTVDGKVRWFDSRNLDYELTGFPIARAADIALQISDSRHPVNSSWSAPLVQDAIATLDPVSFSADLEGTFGESGLLYVSLRAATTGDASEWFAAGSTASRFGSFLGNLPARSTVVRPLTNGSASAEFVANRSKFLTPADRRKRTSLNAFRLALELHALGDGSIVLGAPGVYKETITFAIPPNRFPSGMQHLDVTKAYAHYKSDAKFEEGILTITRQLDIYSPLVSGAAVDGAKALWGQIQQDQERRFTLTRTGPVDWSSYAVSVPPSELVSIGWRLYLQNQDFDGALSLFDRGIETNQPLSWYWKSRVLAAVGRFEESIHALNKQVETDPKYVGSYNTLSQMYLDRGDPDKAAEVYQRGLKTNPNNSAMKLSLARAYLAGGKAVEAEGITVSLKLPAPLDRSVKIALATARVCLHKADKSELDLALGRPSPFELAGIGENLINCNADPNLVQQLLAQGFLLTRRFIDVNTDDLRSAFATQFTHAQLLRQRGRLFVRMGKLVDAIADFRAALGMTQQPGASAQLAQILWEAGSKAEAVQLWSDALAGSGVTMESIPEDARRLLPMTKLVDRTWLQAGQLSKSPFPAGDFEPRYYYVRAFEDGSVDWVRELGSDFSPESAVTEVKQLTFPRIIVDGMPLPTAHIVKLTPVGDGSAALLRSNSEYMFSQMTALFPTNFPVRPTAAAAAAAAARVAAEQPADQ